MSYQLAEHKKPSLIFSLNEILQIYGCTNRERVQTVHDVVDYNAQTVEKNNKTEHHDRFEKSPI